MVYASNMMRREGGRCDGEYAKRGMGKCKVDKIDTF